MPLTVGENSYVSVADATTYLQYAVHATAWTDLSTSLKESGLISATRMLDRQNWAGSKTASSQDLQWPRTGLTDRNGNELADDAVPQEIIDATCELAIALINDPDIQGNPDTDQNIKRLKADTVEIEFIRGKSGPRFPLIVQELVGLWLSQGSSSYEGPFFSGADNVTELSDTFDLNGGL